MRTICLCTLLLFSYSTLTSQSFIRGPFTNKHISLPVVADFSGDGKSDVVGISRFFSPVGDLRLHRNTSQADSIIFETVDLGLEALGEPGSGDFDADGDMDLVVTESEDSTILILLNNGDGTFESHPQNAEPAHSFRASDMDGDDDIDIVSLNEDEFSVFLMLNDGHGAFQSMSILTQEEDLSTIELGDLDGDEDMDIIAGFDYFFDAKIIWLQNNGSGLFEEKPITDVAIGGLENIQIADVDKDGDMDIVYSSSSTSSLRFLNNNGNQAFSETNLVNGLGRIRSFNVADYNTDGIMDVLIGCNDEDNTYHQGLSSTALEYSSEVISGIQPMFHIVNGDFNSDGALDAIISNSDFWWITNQLEQGHVGLTVIDDAEYEVYPNPFIDYLHLPISSDDMYIYVSDLSGHLLRQFNGKTSPVPLADLKAGCYVLSLKDRMSGKPVQTSIIIKIE